MVEDEGEAGQALRGLDGGIELVRLHHEVVDESRLGDRGQAAQCVRAHEPAGVGLALHLGPADDPGDQVAARGYGREATVLVAAINEWL